MTNKITEAIISSISDLYKQKIDRKLVQIQATRKEFSGDWTVVVFPFLRFSRKKPEDTATEIGNYLQTKIPEISNFNVIKGFLNLKIDDNYWLDFFSSIHADEKFGFGTQVADSKPVMIEFSSPNTNKPLHLGHIRNNLLGDSISRILKASGKQIIKVNLVNDRGIHICKSMLAWSIWGEGETPESSKMKGDHLVGKYYVKFDFEYKKQVADLLASGLDAEKAKKEAPLLLDAQEMLRLWEAGDTKVRELWQTMNNWVYAGFEATYRQMGIDFDKIYYESNTYQLGRQIVLDALAKGILFRKEDGSVWADLTGDGLDEKILLRSDGTSVYMTQDIGTAVMRFEEFALEKSVYVVGNEQDYHFKVLALVLQKMGYEWAKDLYHLSYGMVDLPSGKMKSREGTVVDADQLMDEMIDTARQTSQELGKLDNYSPEEAEKIYETVALGALKYFILKVDPKKRMMFNPQESIDFNGNTGPFIQYTHARIKSLLQKAKQKNIEIPTATNQAIELNNKEIALIKLLYKLPEIIAESAKNYSPALVANYAYDLVKEYNQFYQEINILREENLPLKQFRLLLSQTVARTIKTCMGLLGIDVPERM